MLGFMRKNSNSWVVTLVFLALIVAFAISFNPAMGRVETDNHYAAVVNNQAIPMSEFQFVYGRQLSEIQRYQPGFTPEQAEQMNLKSHVLDRLIERELLAQLAQKNGLIIDNAFLTKTVKAIFFGDKAFDYELYKRRLNGELHQTEAQFESTLKKQLLAERMLNLVNDAVLVSEGEVRSAYVAENEKVSLAILRVDPKKFSVPAPGTKALQTWIKSHESELKEAYQKDLARYQVPAKMKLRHILLKTGGKSESEKAELKLKLEKLRADIAKGKDFSAVAKEFSEDSSAASGGDLGVAGPGMFVKPFEAAAMKLKDGEISPVVETQFGYHLIRMDAHIAAVSRTLEQVKSELATSLLRAREQMELAEAYLELAHQKLNDTDALKTLRIKRLALYLDPENPPKPGKVDSDSILVVTKPFTQSTRYIPGIGVVPELITAAFDPEAKSLLENKRFEHNGLVYAAKLMHKQKADMTSFEKEKPDLRARMLEQRKREFTQDFLAALRKEAKIEMNDTAIHG